MHLLLFAVILFTCMLVFERRSMQMEKKEVKKWQDDEALRRYRMIAPLLETEMDEGKGSRSGRKLRKKTAYPKGRCTATRRDTVKEGLRGCARQTGPKRDSRDCRKTLKRSWDRQCS